MKDASHEVIARAIGDELRQARESTGWTRADVLARLPSDIHPQTLAAYERGVRHCTVARFVEICQTIGVSAAEVIGYALQRGEIDLHTIRIDLCAVLSDNRARLSPLRTWARTRLDEDPGGPGIAQLERSVVHEMAKLFGIDQTEFLGYLLAFTPQPVARRR